jgi:hypothetical protein
MLSWPDKNQNSEHYNKRNRYQDVNSQRPQGFVKDFFTAVTQHLLTNNGHQ